MYAQLCPLSSDTVQHCPLLVVLVISHTLQNFLSVTATTRVCVLERAEDEQLGNDDVSSVVFVEELGLKLFLCCQCQLLFLKASLRLLPLETSPSFYSILVAFVKVNEAK